MATIESNSSKGGKRRILLIGLCCFDVVNVCNSYPREDSDNVAIDQFIRRGGNASNSSTCLSCLLKWLTWKQGQGQEGEKDQNYEIEYFGTFAGDSNAAFMSDDMNSHGIRHDKIIKYPNSIPVCAVIVINAQNGSRTIIHCNKNLPELKANDFVGAFGKDFSLYHWIHAELRKNASEMVQIIRHIRSCDLEGKVTISLEVEQPDETREVALNEDIDYYFVSKDYAKLKGAKNIDESIEVFSKLLERKSKQYVVIVAWGEVGAVAGVIKDGQIIRKTFASAVTPKGGIVVDTTGAGDSFIAGAIFAMQVLRQPVEEAIKFACRFAGAKCGTNGNQGLENFEQFLDCE